MRGLNPASRFDVDALTRSNGSGTSRLGRDVILFVQEEMALLLDFGRGRFYALDDVGARLLSLTVEVGEAEASRRVALEYHVAEERVRADLRSLLRDLRRKRLIASRPAPSGIAWDKILGILRRGGRYFMNPSPAIAARGCQPDARAVAALLAWAWLCIRVFGWARTIRLWRLRQPVIHDTVSVRGAGEAASGPVEAVDRMVRDAAARHLLNVECKERALVGWHLLRGRLGLPAELVIGVQFYPYSGHVWVECEGSVVTDDSARCDAYRAVARFS